MRMNVSSETRNNFSKGSATIRSVTQGDRREARPRESAVNKPLYLCASLFLMLCGFFVAKIPVRPELAFVSSVFVMLFALPSYRATITWLGWQHGLRLLIALGAFAICVEMFAVATGYPYGRFVYGEKIGARVFDLVPWTVPFAWTPLLLAAMTLARRCTTHALRAALLSALILVAIDMTLDPAAVAQGFWTWAQPGLFYQVPLSNFAGWFVSGLLGSFIFQWFVPRANEPSPLALLSSSFLILSFWSSACFWMALWIPAALGFALWLLIAHIFFSWHWESPRRRAQRGIAPTRISL